jgi:hypothetical protein
MPGAVADPIEVPGEYFDICDPTVLRMAAPPSLLTGYDRVAIVTPDIDCPFLGVAAPTGTEVLLNGRLFRSLAVHELGHTLGLFHASGWACLEGKCTFDEYGNAFSAMGGGDGDFNAYEKSRLGWLSGIVRPRRSATHELGSIEGPTTLPQALVVTTAGSEFWFESRGIPTPSFRGDSVQPPGIAVIATPGPGGEASHPGEQLLLPNPNGGARYGYSTGESFVRPKVFKVTVERHEPQSAGLRFEWLDRLAPRRPQLRVRATGRGRIHATWKPAPEQGSGVDAYTLVVDGRGVRRVDEIPLGGWEASRRLSRGWHRVGVFATDRAGNRGPTATARVRVK